MKTAFEEVRSQVTTKLVQERIAGMQIVQLLQKKIEYDYFVSINEKHKKAWLKTFNLTHFLSLLRYFINYLVYWFGMVDLM